MTALNASGNGHYTSEHIVQELVELLAHQIEEAQMTAFSHSPFYGLMIDESTDISITKQLVLYERYVNEVDEPLLSFFKDCRFNGRHC